MKQNLLFAIIAFILLEVSSGKDEFKLEGNLTNDGNLILSLSFGKDVLISEFPRIRIENNGKILIIPWKENEDEELGTKTWKIYGTPEKILELEIFFTLTQGDSLRHFEINYDIKKKEWISKVTLF